MILQLMKYIDVHVTKKFVTKETIFNRSFIMVRETVERDSGGRDEKKE